MILGRLRNCLESSNIWKKKGFIYLLPQFFPVKYIDNNPVIYFLSFREIRLKLIAGTTHRNLFWFTLNQTESDCIYNFPIDLKFRLVPKQSENGKYNHILVVFNRNQKKILCVNPLQKQGISEKKKTMFRNIVNILTH